MHVTCCTIQAGTGSLLQTEVALSPALNMLCIQLLCWPKHRRAQGDRCLLRAPAAV
jgi:hypothetical protein